jgi:hypothetical protein
MALWSAVTVLVAHPEPRRQPAIASKNNFFITCNLDAVAMFAFEKEQCHNRPASPHPMRRGIKCEGTH